MEWIEINEERSNLPEEGIDVLITYENTANQYNPLASRYTMIAYLEKDGKFSDTLDDHVISNVIAWMYMPKPFNYD